jgi:hypothetical protein
VARPRGGTADLANAGHWCRSGRGCAQAQAPRAEGRIRRKMAVVRLVAISATATIGNGGSGCCARVGVRGACRMVAQMVHERRRRRGGECSSAGDGGRGREVRKAVYVMRERMYRRSGVAHPSSDARRHALRTPTGLTLVKIVAAPVGSTRAMPASRNNNACRVAYLGCVGAWCRGRGRGTALGVRP